MTAPYPSGRDTGGGRGPDGGGGRGPDGGAGRGPDGGAGRGPVEGPGTDPAVDPAVDSAVYTEEYRAARAAWARKASRGVLAAVLCLEALVLLLVPRAIALTSGLGTVRTVVLIALAVVFVLAAGVLRRPWGIATGSVLQVVFFLTGIMITTMFVIGVVFALIWLRAIMFRHDALDTPGGWRMFAS